MTKHTAKNSLAQNGDFLKLWGGQTISAIGSKVTFLALPLTAMFVLGATPREMGYLTAVGSLPVLLFGLFAGVWVDRQQRRPLLVLADIGRGLLLLLIPLTAWFGLLQMGILYGIIFLNGALSLLFDAAYHAYLPSLVQRVHLVEANSKLAISRSAAEMAGPTLAGWLVQVATAPVAILVDALSFLLSALFLSRIQQPEPAPLPREASEPILHEINAGLRLLLSNHNLRAITASTATVSFFNAALEALYLLYMTQSLKLSAGLIGFIFGAGSIGFLVGALLSDRVIPRLGLGPTMLIGLLLLALADFSLPLAAGPQPFVIALLIAAQLCFGVGFTFYNVGQISLRQAITPDHMLGRMNATLDFGIASLIPLGGLVGGLTGEWLGLRPTLLFAASGELLAGLWLLFSPVRSFQQEAAKEQDKAISS